MRCRSCGYKLLSEFDFCPICGAWNIPMPDVLNEEGNFIPELEEFAKAFMEGLVEANPQELEQNRKEWWAPYAEPLPTWETLEGYGRALRMVREHPFSESILDVDVKSYISGFSEADGYFGYLARADRPYASPLYALEVSDRRAVEYICRALRRPARVREIRPRHFRYGVMLVGLPAVTFYRIIEPTLHGYGKDKAKFIIEHGFRVSRQTLIQFARTFPFGRAYRRRVILHGSEEIVEVAIVESAQREEAYPIEIIGMEEEIERHY